MKLYYEKCNRVRAYNRQHVFLGIFLGEVTGESNDI